MMPSNNNYAAWVYGSLQRNAARFCSTERLQTQILCGGMSACGRLQPAASDRGFNRSMQHLDSHRRGEDVAYEVTDEDPVQRGRQGIDVGTMARG